MFCPCIINHLAFFIFFLFYYYYPSNAQEKNTKQVNQKSTFQTYRYIHANGIGRMVYEYRAREKFRKKGLVDQSHFPRRCLHAVLRENFYQSPSPSPVSPVTPLPSSRFGGGRPPYVYTFTRDSTMSRSAARGGARTVRKIN